MSASHQIEAIPALLTNEDQLFFSPTTGTTAILDRGRLRRLSRRQAPYANPLANPENNHPGRAPFPNPLRQRAHNTTSPPLARNNPATPRVPPRLSAPPLANITNHDRDERQESLSPALEITDITVRLNRLDFANQENSPLGPASRSADPRDVEEQESPDATPRQQAPSVMVRWRRRNPHEFLIWNDESDSLNQQQEQQQQQHHQQRRRHWNNVDETDVSSRSRQRPTVTPLPRQELRRQRREVLAWLSQQMRSNSPRFAEQLGIRLEEVHCRRPRRTHDQRRHSKNSKINRHM